MAALLFVATILGAYLIGSVPCGFLVAHWRGINIFQQGSGNIGATNVGRVLGRRLGFLVFFLDFAKGAVPVGAALWLARWSESALDVSVALSGLGVAAGLAAFLGHLFPVYLRFHGGKGVATGAGVIVVLVPGPALAALVAWVGVVLAAGYISLASLAAALALLLFQLLTPDPFAAENLIMTLFCALAASLVFLRHHANIRRLLHGTENRLKDTPAMVTLSKTVHVLVLGLWFGMVVFFMVVASIVFDSLETLGQQNPRPRWFPVEAPYTKEHKADNILGPKEQGTRVAGFALSPVFPYYFLIQGVCGFLAVATALAWPRLEPGRRLHRIRVVLLIAALASVVAGWPLEQKVDELRTPRHEAVEHYLKTGTTAARDAAIEAKKEFGTWHLYSLLLNFVTLCLVGPALALAAQLPAGNNQLSRGTVGAPSNDPNRGPDAPAAAPGGVS